MPGHGLVEVGVGGHDDVGGLQPAGHLDPADELVDEPDVARDAERLRPGDERLAVRLALVAHEVRVGRADDRQEDGRSGLDDGRQGIEHELQALGRSDQAEGQDDLMALDAEAVLDRVGREHGQIGDAVGDDLDARPRQAVARRQQLGGRARHDHGRRGSLDDLAQDDALALGRVRAHGVEGRDRGQLEGAQEVEDRFAVLAAPDGRLVLDGHDVDAAAEVAGRVDVVGRLILADAVVDLEGIGRAALRGQQGGDLTAAGGGGKGVGERGDAASTGRVGGHERGPGDDVVLSGVTVPCRPDDGRTVAVCRRSSRAAPAG